MSQVMEPDIPQASSRTNAIPDLVNADKGACAAGSWYNVQIVCDPR